MAIAIHVGEQDSTSVTCNSSEQAPSKTARSSSTQDSVGMSDLRQEWGCVMRRIAMLYIVICCCVGLMQCSNEVSSPDPSSEPVVQLSEDASATSSPEAASEKFVGPVIVESNAVTSVESPSASCESSPTAAEGSSIAERRALANAHEVVVEVKKEAEGIIPRWDIEFRGMLVPDGPPGCWYNPFSFWIASMPLSCHRPGDFLTIDESFTAKVEFSVTGEQAADIHWEGFRFALFNQHRVMIGANVTRGVTTNITPWNCLSATVYAFPPYQCLVFDVTWTWLSYVRTATVYVWKPIDGACLVWAGATYEPGCDNCDEEPYYPDNGNWFCGSDNDGEPVWSDWCDYNCTDNPFDVHCVLVPRSELDIIGSISHEQQQEDLDLP